MRFINAQQILVTSTEIMHSQVTAMVSVPPASPNRANILRPPPPLCRRPLPQPAQYGCQTESIFPGPVRPLPRPDTARGNLPARPGGAADRVGSARAQHGPSKHNGSRHRPASAWLSCRLLSLLSRPSSRLSSPVSRSSSRLFSPASRLSSLSPALVSRSSSRLSSPVSRPSSRLSSVSSRLSSPASRLSSLGPALVSRLSVSPLSPIVSRHSSPLSSPGVGSQPGAPGPVVIDQSAAQPNLHQLRCTETHCRRRAPAHTHRAGMMQHPCICRSASGSMSGCRDVGKSEISGCQDVRMMGCRDVSVEWCLL